MGAYLSQILADAPGGAASTSGAASSEQLKQTLKTANYLASRGPEGLKALKALCASPTVQGVALPDAWQTRIPLEGACMNGHTDSTMKYLVEDVGVLINLPEEGSGDAPLHSAVAWGRPECAAYLLKHGASLSVTDAAGLTPIEAAERRQALLEANDAPTLARYESKGMDVKSLIEGGKYLVKLLHDVQAAGSWAKYEASL
mmetsp:Transcript_20171/g.60160  ORF Transcript_20171/g.60160 Transcript_20171/m.60160 type:complete len:201 (-) Transcript_20171:88-690(-)